MAGVGGKTPLARERLFAMVEGFLEASQKSVYGGGEASNLILRVRHGQVLRQVFLADRPRCWLRPLPTSGPPSPAGRHRLWRERMPRRCLRPRSLRRTRCLPRPPRKTFWPRQPVRAHRPDLSARRRHKSALRRRTAPCPRHARLCRAPFARRCLRLHLRKVDRFGEHTSPFVPSDDEDAVEAEFLNVFPVQGCSLAYAARGVLGPLPGSVLHVRQQGTAEQEEERNAENREYRPYRQGDEQRQAPPDGHVLRPPSGRIRPRAPCV
jgi:hypothetical protein